MPWARSRAELQYRQTGTSQRGSIAGAARIAVADMYQLKKNAVVVSMHSHRLRNPR
jgi:hypothetical protein